MQQASNKILSLSQFHFWQTNVNFKSINSNLYNLKEKNGCEHSLIFPKLKLEMYSLKLSDLRKTELKMS